MLAFCEFSFGPDTHTFRVAGVWILSTQAFRVTGVRILSTYIFGVFCRTKALRFSLLNKLRKMRYAFENVSALRAPSLKQSIKTINELDIMPFLAKHNFESSDRKMGGRCAENWRFSEETIEFDLISLIQK